MSRTLKTFLTAIGFFELAVAAPSMKAALEAWGAQRNLFQQGLAWETDDAAIVKATLAHPGIVLKRAVGTKGPFQEKAQLSTELPASAPGPSDGRQAKGHKAHSKPPSPDMARAQKAAIIQFDRQKAQRERERERQDADQSKRDAAQARTEQRRAQAANRIQEQIDTARQRHEEAQAEIEDQRIKLDRRADTENRRWNLERQRLQGELKKL